MVNPQPPEPRERSGLTKLSRNRVEGDLRCHVLMSLVRCLGM
jgi:hypothetical protein